ncbi:MAG TPA: hypothetical protein VHV30_06465 [Polyangiaceae bacterium]|jgi:hypothetical protein|nr:hypothetical protein [Polyangiaceae bacterium]
MAPRKTFAPSGILGTVWNLEEAGSIRLVAATREVGISAVAAWTADDSSRLVEWAWSRLLRQHSEAFALVGAQGVPRALWCSRRDRLLALPCGPSYELGYLELHPQDRGTLLGYYVLAVIAARAIETGARGMVLASLPHPKVQAFYSFAGGKAGKVKGWQTPFGLVQYFFSEEALRALQQELDAREARSL